MGCAILASLATVLRTATRNSIGPRQKINNSRPIAGVFLGGGGECYLKWKWLPGCVSRVTC
jgi:hypothetical protein